jgi:hypothetical protein
MAVDETPVSWTAIAQGAIVVAADGQEVGKVQEVTGDEDADIFDGLVVSAGLGRRPHYVAAERVTHMTEDRVETSLSAEEAASLPPYDEPVTTSVRADEGGGVVARARAAFKDLFGRR